MGVFAYTQSILYFPLATVILAAFAITFFVLQPYRSTVHNVNDSFLILSMIIGYSSVMANSIDIAFIHSNSFLDLSLTMLYLSGLAPLFHSVLLVVYWLVIRKKLPQMLFHKLVHSSITEEQQMLQESLPERIVHAEAYTALIPAPMSGGECHSDSESGDGHQHDRMQHTSHKNHH